MFIGTVYTMCTGNFVLRLRHSGVILHLYSVCVGMFSKVGGDVLRGSPGSSFLLASIVC